MYDCFYPDDVPARQPVPSLHRRCLRLSACRGAESQVPRAESALRALGFAVERRQDGSLLVFDLSVHTALSLQQRWPELIGQFEIPPLCRSHPNIISRTNSPASGH
ncbi:hypothetical protein GCM10007860_19430 [Chitiniphilus shinanonensis]|uniref:Transcriptional regulator n=2 Tax=Chitiniphilus shinanonensis TaxID=553088 RepID=A0ABQ6BS32_9NEIS|nr:hypothetical protein [Chitiniphilus shinanonensis]GLS04795.1 hypothetical protein GCM10007860_19430 [Chitiniphilus shinanonensis]